MKEMVLGFYFNKGTVVLVKKDPEDPKMAWMKGKLNGTGGKVNPGEDPAEAMVREHREECGIETDVLDWTPFARMQSEAEGWVVYCYEARGDKTPSMTPAQVREPANMYITSEVKSNRTDIVENLAWLIALALDRNPRKQEVTINYSEPIVAIN